MTIPVVRKRAKRPKTRTGCRTCRARHIKCDESRPACRRCTSTGRVCDGYEVSPALLPGAPKSTALLLPKDSALPNAFSVSSNPCRPIDLTLQECRAFDYFRTHTVKQLPGGPWEMSWERMVLQVFHQEPAIMHAVVAVGWMHHLTITKGPTFLTRLRANNEQEFAIGHYAKAMAYMRSYIENIAVRHNDANIEIVLLMCLLFVCIEILQGGDAGAVVHLRIGLRLIYEHYRSYVSSNDEGDTYGPSNGCRRLVPLKIVPQSSLDTLLQVFVRLDYEMTLFGEMEPFLRPVCSPSTPISFASLGEARIHLDALASATYSTRGRLLRCTEQFLLASDPHFQYKDDDTRHCIIHASSQCFPLELDSTLIESMEEVRRGLASWMSALAFIPFASHRDGARAHLMIQIQFFYIWFLASIWRDISESRCDRFEDQFTHVLSLAERYASLTAEEGLAQSPQPESPTDSTNPDLSAVSSTFTLGTGILPSLAIVALKCRTSSIRRRAVDLIEKSNTWGMFDSATIAAFLKRFVQFEEERARAIGGFPSSYTDFQCHEVPEEARLIEATLTDADIPAGRLVCASWLDGPGTQVITFDDIFNLEDYIT